MRQSFHTNATQYCISIGCNSTWNTRDIKASRQRVSEKKRVRKRRNLILSWRKFVRFQDGALCPQTIVNSDFTHISFDSQWPVLLYSIFNILFTKRKTSLFYKFKKCAALLFKLNKIMFNISQILFCENINSLSIIHVNEIILRNDLFQT